MAAKLPAPEQGKTPEELHAASKAAFAKAVEKTKAEAGEAPEKEEAEEPLEVVEIEEPKPKRAKRDDGELRALREEIASLKASVQERAKAKPEPEPEAEEDDYEAIAAELQEEFGEKEGGILAKALQRMVEPRERRIRQIEKMLEEGMKRGRVQIERSNRARLSEKYENLKDSDEAWDVVQTFVATKLQDQNSKYASAEDAYDAAVKALYGEAKAARQELPSDDDVREASRIAASQPTIPGRAAKEKKMTPMQAARASFDHLYKNIDDVAGARRIANQHRSGD